MKKVIFLLLFLPLMFSWCSPSTFIKVSDPGWASIQVRDGLTFEGAWNEAVDVVAKKFEMEIISKDGGYARTNWIYTWNTNGKYTKNYRNRVFIKFSADRTKVDIKTESQYGSEGKWTNGYDTRLLETIKQDISGVVGRTVR